MSLFKAFRILVLLLILVIVAGNYWLGMARLATWKDPVWITVYPIPVDGKPETLAYVQRLEAPDFREVGEFFTREARRYGLDLPRAAHFQLAPVPEGAPPPVPATDSRVAVALWSLKTRWWAWRRQRGDGLPAPDIQVFMLFRSAEGEPRLDRSVGVQKGRYTIVNAYAAPRMGPRNRLVIAHEVLHVLGATDKYEPASGLPRSPDGLADPRANPLYPQSHAEIMAGAIAVSPDRALMPPGLARSVVGEATAREIGWED